MRHRIGGGILHSSADATPLLSLIARSLPTIGSVVIAALVLLPAAALGQSCIEPENAAGVSCTNSGDLTLTGSGFTNAGTFYNSSWLAVQTGQLFVNSGIMSNDSYIAVFDGEFVNSATFNNNGVLDVSGTTGSFVNTGTFNNTAWVSVGAGFFGGVGGAFSNSGTFDNSGFVYVGAFSAFSSSSVFNNNAGGSLQIAAYGTFENTGTFNNNAGAELSFLSGGLFDNSGTFNDQGVITYDARFLDETADAQPVTFNNLAGGTLNSGTSMDLGGGTLSNAGIVSPGGTGAIATTNLNGSFVQTSTGTLKIDADWASGSADRLAVSGTATLAGSVVVNPLNFPTTGGLTKQFTILTAAGGITDNGIAIANTAAVDYALLYPDANTLNVMATINFQGIGNTGLTGNQSALAGSLNAILGGGTTLGFMPALMSLPAGGLLGGALDQLAPIGDGAATAAALSTANTFAAQMLSCRSAGEGDGYAVIREGQCVWARANGRRLDRDGGTDGVGYREKSAFLSAGAQLRPDGDWRIGAGIGYETTSLDTESHASTMGERVHLGAVLKYNPGPWLLAAGIAGGHGWFDNVRRVSFAGFDATATSSSASDFLSGRLTAAHLMALGGDFYLKPQLDMVATRLWRGGYDESGGGGIALSFAASETTVLSLISSLELGAEIRNSHGSVYRPFIRGGVTWLDTGSFTTTAAFQGAPAGAAPFSTSTKIDRLVADFGAGVDLISRGDTVLRLQYDGQRGETTVQHGGSAKLTVNF